MQELSLLLLAIAATLTLTSASMEFCGGDKNGRYCAAGAECTDGQQCSCPLASPYGHPLFGCHSENTVSCTLVGDPSITSYTGDVTFVDFPCKYTLAKVDTTLSSRKFNSDPPNSWSVADPGRDRCRIIAHGTNAATPKGTYYLKTVQVNVAFNIGGSSKLESLSVTIDSDQAVYTYPPNPETTLTKEAASDCTVQPLDYQNSIGLSLCYVESTRMWSLGIPICGATFINFRAWEGESENQPMRPGFSITTNGDNALFSESENDFPSTMCGSPYSDEDDVFHSTCKSLGLQGKRNCALFAFLDNSPPQQPHYCVPAIELFAICPANKKTAAINKCGSILTQLGKCVLKNDKDLMNTFEACLAAVCDINNAICPSIASYVNHGDEEDCNAFQNPCED